MKTLYLVRHAKSSWKHDVVDHQRPLKGRGERDGILVSNEVSEKLAPPQRIISSDALRASTTAKFFKAAFKVADRDYQENHSLYDFSGTQVLRIIHGLDDDLDRVMLVGHNHAFTSIANMLGNTYIDNVPTCGFVQLQFDETSWKDVHNGTTIYTVFPRDLKE